jgi:hypothetical protein
LDKNFSDYQKYVPHDLLIILRALPASDRLSSIKLTKGEKTKNIVSLPFENDEVEPEGVMNS